MNFNELNRLSAENSRRVFLRCCGATRWAEEMSAARPFRDPNHLLATASEVWHGLGREDHLEAFAAHPKIGDISSLRSRFPSTKDWSEGEQAGMADTSEEILNCLAQGNRSYEQRFGSIFIVCASGKSAQEILTLLEERLSNDLDKESVVAAAEQEKITQLRLLKLLDSGDSAS